MPAPEPPLQPATAATTTQADACEALPPPPLGYELADSILVEHFESLLLFNDEMTDVILTMRGAFMTNTTGEAFCVEIQRRLRPDPFTAAAIQAQGRFYRSLRDLRITRGVSVEPPGLARHNVIAIKVTNTIWQVAGHTIADSLKRIRRRLPHVPSRPSLHELLHRTPLCAHPQDDHLAQHSNARDIGETQHVDHINRGGEPNQDMAR